MYPAAECVEWIVNDLTVYTVKIRAMEMRCYRKILRISDKDHVFNEEVCAKVQLAIGPHEDLFAIVKSRNLQRYALVSRSSCLAKTILPFKVH